VAGELIMLSLRQFMNQKLRKAFEGIFGLKRAIKVYSSHPSLNYYYYYILKALSFRSIERPKEQILVDFKDPDVMKHWISMSDKDIGGQSHASFDFMGNHGMYGIGLRVFCWI
jgi:hypothetical protein